MIPLRLVLDTNIVVSAVLMPEGPPRTVLLLATAKPVRWYVTEKILEEYAAVLQRPRLRIRKELRQQFLQLVKRHAHTVVPSRLPQVTADPADNIFIECANAAR